MTNFVSPLVTAVEIQRIHSITPHDQIHVRRQKLKDVVYDGDQRIDDFCWRPPILDTGRWENQFSRSVRIPSSAALKKRSFTWQAMSTSRFWARVEDNMRIRRTDTLLRLIACRRFSIFGGRFASFCYVNASCNNRVIGTRRAHSFDF